MSAESDYISWDFLQDIAQIMKNKMFDCVQVKRRGAELVHKQLEGKSFEQQLEYWQKGTDQLKELQKQAKEKK